MKCNNTWLSAGLLAVVTCSVVGLATRRAHAAPPAGFVHASGGQIMDGSDHAIKLRGVNLGGSMLWEGWIFGMNSRLLVCDTCSPEPTNCHSNQLHAETSIFKRLAEKLPEAEVEQWRRDVYANGIRPQDFQRIAQLGYNVVRLPFNHLVLEDDDNPFVYKDSGWELFDNILAWAESYGVYVVLDMHSAPGGQSTTFIADPEDGQAKLWDPSTNNRERTVALWRAIANRYADRTIVAGYDLLNEPIPPSGAELISLYQEIIAAIREVDDNHMVFVEGGFFEPDYFTMDFSFFTEALDPNQAYSFHQYTWGNEDRQAQLNDWGSVAMAHGLPLWNGEFGVNTYAIVDSTVAMYEDHVNGIDGYAYWTWKRTPSKAMNTCNIPGYQDFPALRRVAPNSLLWQPVVNWLDHVASANPSATQIRAGLNDYLTKLRFENTLEDASTVAALVANGRPSGGPAWRNATGNFPGYGDGFEVQPDGAYVPGGSAARNSNNVGDSQGYYSFNISVPLGKSVAGIEVRVDHSADSSAGGPALAIVLSNDGGSTWTGTRSVPIASTSLRTDYVGWSEDLWGKAWTTSSVSNANFIVGVMATCVAEDTCAGVRDFNLDYLSARVFLK